MKILILDGNPEEDREVYEVYLRDLVEGLHDSGHDVKLTHLREADIRFCTGCWTCWVKTPGLCVFSDDAVQIHRDYLDSDLVLFASPVVMGFLSALMVKLQDRLIPLLHPYIIIEGRESHHRKRYPRYPEVGLILDRSADTDDEDLSITMENFERFAVNFKSDLRIASVTDRGTEEVVNEIGFSTDPRDSKEIGKIGDRHLLRDAPGSQSPFFRCSSLESVKRQKLVVFNGSPRGAKSNSKILMDHLVEGFREKGGTLDEVVYLHHTKDIEEHVRKFREAEHVILAFPLYTDDMPGIVKNFIEALASLCGREDLPCLGIVIQSGFPEPRQSRFLERYMIKLVKRLGCSFTGSVIKGAVEGIQEMPERLTRGLYRSFHRLGEGLAETGVFDPEIVKALAPRDEYSTRGILVFRLLKFLGLADFYWNRHLKRNKAYPRRFDRPYDD